MSSLVVVPLLLGLLPLGTIVECHQDEKRRSALVDGARSNDLAQLARSALHYDVPIQELLLLFPAHADKLAGLRINYAARIQLI